MISTYWEGDIPLQPLLIGVQDEYNNRIWLGEYEVEPVMLDSDNRKVDLTGFTIIHMPEPGVFQFLFPTDKVVLNKHGDYQLQFVLVDAEGNREQRTAPHTIRVRALGKRGRK